MSATTNSQKGAIRIAGCSGSAADRRQCLARFAKSDEVDAIIGDWLSEYNMTIRGANRTTGADLAFEPSFVESLMPALDHLKGKKLVCNAGASDTAKLAQVVQGLVSQKGLDLKVAWIEGDEVTEQVKAIIAKDGGASFKSLTDDSTLKEWGFEPLCAQAYLGAFGIVAALEQGADIVLCGRVADASPVVGLAAWWHGWKRTDFAALAGSLVAGHLIECSNYITGGNWSGFKALMGKWNNLAYPIAEIEADGTHIVGMETGQEGVVNVATCTTQLVYEIQGPLYYNSDVVADLTDIRFEEVGKNRVRVSGIKGIAPPPTTKVGVTAHGGYQCESSWYLCGLDIKEKGEMLEDQIRCRIDQTKFSKLEFTYIGTAATNPESQNEATVEFRIFAQAKEEDTLNPLNFLRHVFDQIMQSYPGATPCLDTRLAFPKPIFEYFVSIISQSEMKHIAHLHDGSSITIPAPTDTVPHKRVQDSYEASNAQPLDSFGPTEWAPLGVVVHARSGDKGDDANFGAYVRNADEWEWLRALLTVDKVKELLGKDYKGGRVDRFEMKNIWAVHFLLKGHLDRGVSCTSTRDYLGKNVAEYIRAKYVDVPSKFLERGKI